MMTLRQLAKEPASIPTATAWYLADLGRAVGKQELFYINFVLYTLLGACTEFERRVGQTASPRGAKTELVLAAIDRRSSSFQTADLQRDCPGVSLDLIRRVLKHRASSGQLFCEIRGPKSLWRKTDAWNLGIT